MVDLFHDYTKAVMKLYDAKREANQLSSRLARPTPARLKQECEMVFAERYDQKDEKTIRDFFGGDQNGYAYAMMHFNINKFKPLINFLKGDIKQPLEQNIELLAWLIDFQPRPYLYGTKYSTDDTDETTQVGGPEGEQDEGGEVVRTVVEEPVKNDSPAKHENNTEANRKRKRRWLVAIPIIAGALGGFGFLMANNKKIVYKPTGPQGCMYWKGDHYEVASCNEKNTEGTLIALDEERVKNFRKVMRPDTITQYSVGRMWYVRVEDHYEFFTDSGYHPVLVNRRLRKLSHYIVGKMVE